MTERQLRSVLADVCDLQDSVYSRVDRSTCCKVRLRLFCLLLVQFSSVMIVMMITASDNNALKLFDSGVTVAMLVMSAAME